MSRVGAETEGERESQAGSALSAWSPMQGSNPRTVRSWPELKSEAQPTEPPRCPPMTPLISRRQSKEAIAIPQKGNPLLRFLLVRKTRTHVGFHKREVA